MAEQVQCSALSLKRQVHTWDARQ